MRVLVPCEFSGVVRESFAKLGHDAWSCDTEPTLIPGKHFQCDIREVLYQDWDLIIAHPPCTYLSNSGVRWLYRKVDGKNVNYKPRWKAMREGAEFFKLFLDHPCPKICVENPIPHKWAKEIIGADYTQVLQPWQYGHGETKATCLWLKGLSPLEPTNIVDGREPRIHKMPPSDDRGKLRSIFFQGFGDAMADQWGGKVSTGVKRKLKKRS